MYEPKIPLEIEIYWRNGDDCKLEDLGIEVTRIPETKLVTFYSIDYHSRGDITSIPHEVGFLSSGREEFATTLSYQKLGELIKQHL